MSLVLLPGLLCDAALWAPQVGDLSDLDSAWIADLTRHDSISEMAAAVLREAPVERFSLAGLSMGGYVAQEIVRQAPRRVERLALLDTRARPDEPDETQRRRDLMVKGLDALPGVTCRMPEGAFYAFADVSGLLGARSGDRTLKTDDDVAMWLLAEANAATVAGTPFGAPGYLRLSYACADEDITNGLSRIGEAIAKLERG